MSRKKRKLMTNCKSMALLLLLLLALLPSDCNGWCSGAGDCFVQINAGNGIALTNSRQCSPLLQCWSSHESILAIDYTQMR